MKLAIKLLTMLLHAITLFALICAPSYVAAQNSVQELAERWSEAYNKHDCVALGAVYTENARLMMHNSATIVGRARIEELRGR